ncbi:MAG: beta-galactosidase trimerization domain-containing protein [Abditibacteriota bacterium]|nr:beta-galactosidase trimerization domain-containing protein [Abditibacteriota bacterium]
MNWHEKCCFGIHLDDHALRGDTELGKDLTFENLYDSLSKINPDWVEVDSKGHPGFTTYYTSVGYQPEGLKKDCLQIYADVCKALKIPLVCHHSGVIDTNACRVHPDWACKKRDGSPYDDHSRDSLNSPTCLTSDYEDKQLIPQLIEIIKKYDVDGFWIDGDCWGYNYCYCERCKKRFMEETGLPVPESDDAPTFDAYRKWEQKLFFNYVQKYTDAIHAVKPNCLVTSAWLYGLNAVFDNFIDIDWVSGDDLNTVRCALTNGRLMPNLPYDWDIMTWSALNDGVRVNWSFKPIETFYQNFGYIIACGGAAQSCFSKTRTGLLDKHVVDTYRKIGEFVRQRAPYVRGGKSIPEVAVIINPSEFYGKNFMPNVGNEKIFGLCQILADNHINYDVLLPSLIDLEKYKLIIISNQGDFSDEFVHKIQDYVQGGGKIICESEKAVKRFAHLLSVEYEGQRTFDDNKFIFQLPNMAHIKGERGTSTLALPYSKVKPINASVFRYFKSDIYSEGFETQDPAITINNFGKGLACGININLFEQYEASSFKQYRLLFEDILNHLNLNFNLKDVKAPFYIHFVVKEKDSHIAISVVNTGKISESDSKSPMTDEIPQVYNIEFSYALDFVPKNVRLIPGGENLEWNFKDGLLKVRIKALDIYEVLVIEK